MASTNRSATNRANAQLSTGPRTAAGKAAAKRNAVSHGLRSAAPVVPGERAKDWHEHRDGVVAFLAPVGTLETDLADRVAALTWRLRRVTAYETNVTVAGVEDAVVAARGGAAEPDPLRGPFFRTAPSPRTHESVRTELDIARERATEHARTCDLFRRVETAPPDEALAGGDAVHLLLEATDHACGDEIPDEDDEDDDGFYTRLGVPPEFRDEPEAWGGWSVVLVTAGLTHLAEDAGLTTSALLARCVRRSGAAAEAASRRVTELETELAALARQRKAAVRSARAKAILPDAAALDRIVRYEAHLSKQLTQTLHLLERLQLARAGTPAAPPIALDLTVNAEPLALNPAG